MNIEYRNETIKWLTIKEAVFHCQSLGLPRSVKSLRRWCGKSEIEAQKRQIGTGEKWFIDRESLEIKIQEEIEFLNLTDKPLPSPESLGGHGVDMSGHRSRAVISAQGVDTPGHANIRDLEDQIMLLKNDIKWRDRVLKDQKQAAQTLMDEVKGQSRYIGHLETNVLRLGGNTDQTFLAAPVPKYGHSDDIEDTAHFIDPEIIQDQRPHPDQ